MFVYLLFLCLLFSVSSHNADVNEDDGLDFVAMAQHYGYPVETHQVTTRDGYILTVFRINGSPNLTPSSDPKPVVLMQHGLFDSSWTWVALPPGEGLGFGLADSGFDCWFGNNRGNRYGRAHTTLDPDSKTDSSFWDFSWDEMATEDLPAMINYIKATTGVSSLGYAGHSEGTIQMIAASSLAGQQQQLESKSVRSNMKARDFVKAGLKDGYLTDAISSVNYFAGLAPVSYVSNLSSRSMRALAESQLAFTLYDKGVWEFLPYRHNVSMEISDFCRKQDLFCDVMLTGISGKSKNVDPARMQVFLSEEPAGTSTRNLQHWTQGIEIDTFQMFDFGSVELNQQHYGADKAPLYDLSYMHTPTGFFAGTNDALATQPDFIKMTGEMPTTTLEFSQVYEGYAHMDFVWGKNTFSEVYGATISELKKHSTI